MPKHLLITGILSVCFCFPASSQTPSATVRGYVHNEYGEAVPLAAIVAEGTPFGGISNEEGFFRLSVVPDTMVKITVSVIGYEPSSRIISVKANEVVYLDFILKVAWTDIEEVSVYPDDREGSLIRLDTRAFEMLPSLGGEIESLLKTFPGVSGRNEFSSRYSVRGGNFDENLVYVNGIEIYRPLLTRSGRQEGLSFINPDLTGSVRFSAGGFSARYGDRMSSVLDITYREPVTFAASASASLLGTTAHAEGVSAGGKFSYIVGGRIRSNQYIMQTLDEKGDYTSTFADLQSLASYQLSPAIRLSLLTTWSGNDYGFTPVSRETGFGTFDDPMRLMIYFEGKDAAACETFSGSLSAAYSDRSLNLILTLSAYSVSESETFDLLGVYNINQVINNLSGHNRADSIRSIGSGIYLNHARNYLNSTMVSISHRGDLRSGDNLTEWGVMARKLFFEESIREWEVIDSSGYNLPYSGHEIETWHLADASGNFSTGRLSAYLQHTFAVVPGLIEFNTGFRTTYCSSGNHLLVSPRSSLTFYPRGRKDLALHISGGLYYQPHMYRELRDRSGNTNTGLDPQKSTHLVAGGDYRLDIWERPFRLSAEIYYKWLKKLIPYTIDNIRTIYSGNGNAKGYAAGIDMKLHGDFVRGIDSWVSLSLLQTRESAENGKEESSAYTGYYPRPTDQLVNFSLFFQDYLPGNPVWKTHLKLVYGSRLPCSPPNTPPHEKMFRMPPYRRADLGISREINKRLKDPGKGYVHGNLRSLWVGAEIFNLLDIRNTGSYLWLRTVSADPLVPAEFAVPGYLSGRRINIRVTYTF